MKRTSKVVAIATSAALAFTSTAALSFAAGPGGGSGGPDAPGGNMGGNNMTISAPADSSFGSSDFRSVGPNGINFGGSSQSNTVSDLNGGMAGDPGNMGGFAPNDMGGFTPNNMNRTDFTANTDITTPQAPDFSGNAPTGELPDGANYNMAPPNFQNGETPDQKDIAARIIEENGLDLNVDEMSDEDIAALVEQYKPTDNQNGRHGRPDSQNGRENRITSIVNIVTNIINKIVEDYNLDFDTEQLTTDKITELINDLMPERNDQNRPERPDFQNSQSDETQAFSGQNMPTPPNFQDGGQGNAPVNTTDNTNVA